MNEMYGTLSCHVTQDKMKKIGMTSVMKIGIHTRDICWVRHEKKFLL